MIIEYGNVWSRLVSYTPDERRWVDEYTSVEEPNRYRAGSWGKLEADDRYRMLHIVTNQFPSGFTAMLLKAAPKVGLQIQVDDQRGPAPCSVDDFADLDWLRPYQYEAVWAATEAGRGLVKAPTGAGKTEVLAGLTRTLPCEWLMVVHRSDLTGQAAARFELRTGEKAGVFDGTWKKGSANFTVSTFQAIHYHMKRRTKGVKELFAGIRGLLVDEVHAQPAASFYRVSMAMKDAYYRIGVSGTPLDRSPRDSLRTIGACGPIVYKIRYSTLEQAGVLSKPKIYMIKCKQEGTTECSWHDAYRQLITESTRRNALVVEMAVRAQKPCLLFVDHIDHGRELKTLLDHHGFHVDFAHGGHGNGLRLDKIKSLVEGRLDILICSVIFQEGIDIPELESIVMAAGKASVVGTLQRMGRGARVAKGKTGFELWDVLDRGQRWITEHATARRNAYTKEGHEVNVVTLAELDQCRLKAASEGE